MTNKQKKTAAEFLELAGAALGSGFLDGRTVFADDADDADEGDNTETANGANVIAGSGLLGGPADDAPALGQTDDTLELIRNGVCNCTKCPLAQTRENAVPGEGVPRPLVLVVGEGPGADEDETGRPFVGRAGQLLDKMLESIGLSRGTNCFIANIVKCRPPGNRDPAPAEIASCIGYLERQIKLLSPLLILSAGKTSAKTLLQTDRGITSIRGAWSSYKGIPLLPTFHPSYLLRDERQKVYAWEDMKSLCLKLCELSPNYESQTRELRKKRNIIRSRDNGPARPQPLGVGSRE